MAKNEGGFGKLLFSVGAVIAIVMGVGAAMKATWANLPWLILVLVLIGLIVGFKNVASKEVSGFLMGTISLILATAVANLIAIDTLIPGVGTFVQASLSNFIIVVGAAAVIVSFRAVYGLAKN